MSGRTDFPKLCLFLLLLGTRIPKDIRCGGDAKWVSRVFFRCFEVGDPNS